MAVRIKDGMIPYTCNYNITGGCKYLCGTRCYHCFTSNGTLTIN